MVNSLEELQAADHLVGENYLKKGKVLKKNRLRLR